MSFLHESPGNGPLTVTDQSAVEACDGTGTAVGGSPHDDAECDNCGGKFIREEQ